MAITIGYWLAGLIALSIIVIGGRLLSHLTLPLPVWRRRDGTA